MRNALTDYPYVKPENSLSRPISTITGKPIPTEAERFQLYENSLLRKAANYLIQNALYRGKSGPPPEWIDRSHPNFTPSIYGDRELTPAMMEIPVLRGGGRVYKKFNTEKIGSGEGSASFSRAAYSTADTPMGEEIAKYYALRERDAGYIQKWTLHKGKKPTEYDYLEWYEDMTPEQWGKLVQKVKKENMRIEVPSKKAKDIYHTLVFDFEQGGSSRVDAEKAAVKFLQEAGFDGMKYPSGTLQSTKKGNINYATFDPNEMTFESAKRVIRGK